MTESIERPKPGERWRATFEGVVIDPKDHPSTGVWFALLAEGDRAPEEFFQTDGGWLYEKLADAVQPEPGPGSIVLDASGEIWRRLLDPERDFPWGPAYGRTAHGGYRWDGEREPVKPCRVLYDPSEEQE